MAIAYAAVCVGYPFFALRDTQMNPRSSRSVVHLGVLGALAVAGLVAGNLGAA